MLRSCMIFVAGGGAATALVLACSDDSPGDADAACECEPAEPPLEGRVHTVEAELTDQPGDVFLFTVACDEGDILLGGGCENLSSQNENDVYLYDAGRRLSLVQPTFACSWANPVPVNIERVRAWAVCLTPAE